MRIIAAHPAAPALRMHIMGWIRQWARRLVAWWRGAPPARPLAAADREAIDRVRSRLLRQIDDATARPHGPRPLDR